MKEKFIAKTLGNGEKLRISNPDMYDIEGNFRKLRLGGNNRKKIKRRK
jgi:hypothetical protein